MIRLIAVVLTVGMGAGLRDRSQASDLIRKLDSTDWVEQAQAAKALVTLGPPVLDALKAAGLSDSPPAKYWASQISEAILRSVPSPTPPLPVAPEPVAVTNPKGFAPGPNDLGALVFICNTPAHGPYEATFSRCVSCAKTKRFAYDYGADCYRCAVCKRAYSRKDLTCDKCGQPPSGRIPIRMKTAGGL
ncbi:MAG TPA: hypothetical protein VKW04_12830 [Planctomycetota bacterium]|nr:hypothetical protein [Planctomycetota bacterium]